MTGLPPTPEWTDAFAADESPEAYEVRVNELLASPHYGEKWARHWLDVVRYADSEGYENDLEKPLLYRYRDWVIRSFNDDLPFDKFVRWQVAGDEYEPNNPDAVVATGFISSGPRVVPHATDTALNKERYFYDELDDIVNTLGQGFLGLTVGWRGVTIINTTRFRAANTMSWPRPSARSSAARRRCRRPAATWSCGWRRSARSCGSRRWTRSAFRISTACSCWGCGGATTRARRSLMQRGNRGLSFQRTSSRSGWVKKAERNWRG